MLWFTTCQEMVVNLVKMVASPMVVKLLSSLMTCQVLEVVSKVRGSTVVISKTELGVNTVAWMELSSVEASVVRGTAELSSVEKLEASILELILVIMMKGVGGSLMERMTVDGAVNSSVQG